LFWGIMALQMNGQQAHSLLQTSVTATCRQRFVPYAR